MYGDRIAVLAVAIESDEADVRASAPAAGRDALRAMGTPQMARAFGDASAVPTLFVFDAKGRTCRVICFSCPAHAARGRRGADR